MDEVIPILFVSGLVLAFLLGPWILVWRGRNRRKRERAEDQARLSELTNRVYKLERSAKEWQAEPASGAPEAAASDTTADIRAEMRLQTPAMPVRDDRPAAEPASVAAILVPQTAARSLPVSPLPSGPAPDSGAAPAHVEPRPAVFSETVGGPSFVDRLRSTLNLEETLGTNWLNKLGVALLVLGVASFLAYQLKTLGPAGKVGVGYACCAVLLGIGVWLERHDRYRILARAGVGGGWALLFFTTYAMYHVPAAQVLSSQAVDLLLMLAVAVGMVRHTLRYRSQVVTGLAFLLAFLTVTISHDTVYSLSAGAVLAAGLVVIVGRMQWFEMEIFGIVATYLNHYLWLRPIIEPMQGHRHPFAEFSASAGMLTAYWIIFRLSYVFRLPKDKRQEGISTGAAVLNTVFLLLLFKYQSVHPQWAFWALLAIGGVETALGQLPVTRRRSAMIVLSTLGVILLIAAFPFRYSGTRLAVLWLLEAEALLLIGVWTREVVFRRLGMIAGVLVAGELLSSDAAQIYGVRMDDADLRPDYPLTMIFGVAAAVFYANAHWILRRWRDLFTTDFDWRLMQRMSYVAALMMFTGAWIAFPETWTAVAWSALGLLLAWSGRRFKVSELLHQSQIIALAALMRVGAINFDVIATYHGLSSRLISVSLVAAIFYLTSWWSSSTEWETRSFAMFGGRMDFPLSHWIAGTYTWAASLLLALLAWYELRPVGVGVAWVVGGLLLFELGLSRKLLSLRLQAYLLFVAGFSRIFFVNLNATGDPGEISPRFYTVIPIALSFFYAQWRLHADGEDVLPIERKLRIEHICSYLGTVSIAALMRFELQADWVAAAWAALVLVLLAVAWRSKMAVFLHQALLVGFGVLFRTGLHNLYERSYFPAPFWESRLVCVGAVVALLFSSLPLAFQLRRKDGNSNRKGILRVFSALGRCPEQVFFFTAVGLLTALLALEMRHGMVTVSWGVEGVAIFLLALALGQRSFRLCGLSLLLLCVGKILIVDVWGLNPRDRYLTLIVLGAALLLVSFLYTRNREALRQYL